MFCIKFNIAIGSYINLFIVYVIIRVQFCTEPVDVPPPPGSDSASPPREAMFGSMRLSQLWGKKELKVHFINPNELQDSGWKYGGYSLNPPQILSWAMTWNNHAKFYPKIHPTLVPIQDSDIRVWFDSGQSYTSLIISLQCKRIFRSKGICIF